MGILATPDERKVENLWRRGYRRASPIDRPSVRKKLQFHCHQSLNPYAAILRPGSDPESAGVIRAGTRKPSYSWIGLKSQTPAPRATLPRGNRALPPAGQITSPAYRGVGRSGRNRIGQSAPRPDPACRPRGNNVVDTPRRTRIQLNVSDAGFQRRSCRFGLARNKLPGRMHESAPCGLAGIRKEAPRSPYLPRVRRPTTGSRPPEGGKEKLLRGGQLVQALRSSPTTMSPTGFRADGAVGCPLRHMGVH